MDLIKELTKSQIKDMPDVHVGDVVRVHVKVKEGSRERIQVFEGTSLSAACPTAWAWRRYSPSTLPLLTRSRLSVTALYVGPSCTTCATAWARQPRCARSSKHEEKTPYLRMRCLFLLHFVEWPLLATKISPVNWNLSPELPV